MFGSRVFDLRCYIAAYCQYVLHCVVFIGPAVPPINSKSRRFKWDHVPKGQLLGTEPAFTYLFHGNPT